VADLPWHRTLANGEGVSSVPTTLRGSTARVLAALLAVAFESGCGGETAGSAGVVDADEQHATNDAGADTEADAGVADAAFEVAACLAPDPAADSDGDGIPDVVEDADRDCEVDPGETDPHAADSDGDGIPDGDEDLDRDGVHDLDDGEFDPRRADTDGDGVLDGDEPVARVCNAALRETFGAWRIPLADGLVALADPAAETVVLEGGDGLVAFDAAHGELTVLHARLSGVASPNEVYDELHTLASGVGGEVWMVAESLSEGGFSRVSELAIRLPGAVPVGLLAAAVPHAEFDVYDLPSLVPASASSVRIRIAAERGGLDGARMMASLRFDDAPIQNPTGCSFDCISAMPASAMRTRCEVVAPRTPEGATVLVVADPQSARTPEGSEVLAALERAADAAGAELLAVDSSAHLEPSLPIAVRRMPGVGLVDTLLGRGDEGTDPRLWANALVAAEAEHERDPARRLVVAVLAVREDTEFRTGETGGLDGMADALALEPGDARLRRTTWYAEALASAGATLVTVGPRAASPLGVVACASVGSDRRVGAAYDDALSLTELTTRVGGTRIDLCYPGAAGIVEAHVGDLLGLNGVIELSEEPIGATVRVSTALGILPMDGTRRSTFWSPLDVLLSGDYGADELGVAYLVWETPSAR
jgi:hypothetical protein